ncbi:MAG: DUF1330 domain-containing protein [Actinomycetota bacterium]|nr:DUF1330 domain-containing protein [Actinomycetota bacterium]
MAVYMIAEVMVYNDELYDKYKELAEAAIKNAGGKYLARGGAVESKEGMTPDRIVILEFPDWESARSFYHGPDYQQAIPMRQAAAEGRIFFVEGVPGT